MDDNQKHLLSEWASGITAAICYTNDITVDQKRGLIDDLVKFKESIGTVDNTTDSEPA